MQFKWCFLSLHCLEQLILQSHFTFQKYDFVVPTVILLSSTVYWFEMKVIIQNSKKYQANDKETTFNAKKFLPTGIYHVQWKALKFCDTNLMEILRFSVPQPNFFLMHHLLTSFSLSRPVNCLCLPGLNSYYSQLLFPFTINETL